MKKTTLFLFLSFVICASLNAQTAEDTTQYGPPRISHFSESVGILVGVQQFRHTSFEIGLAYGSSFSSCIGNIAKGFSLTADINPWRDVYGVKATAWKSTILPVCLGISTSYFNQNKKHDFTISPILGFGFEYLQLTYGYNIRLDQKDIFEKNTHNLSLWIMIPLLMVQS